MPQMCKCQTLNGLNCYCRLPMHGQESLSVSGPFQLTGQGTAGDSTTVTLHLEDDSANLDDDG